MIETKLKKLELYKELSKPTPEEIHIQNMNKVNGLFNSISNGIDSALNILLNNADKFDRTFDCHSAEQFLNKFK